MEEPGRRRLEPMTTTAFHSRIAGLLAEGRSFCCATVVSSRFPGLPAGAKALIFSDGGTEAAGWPEEPLLALRAPARETLRRRLARSAEILPGVRVFFDALGPAAELIVCGAGHIAVPLAGFAVRLGFSVTVIDDRPEFADPRRFPGCSVTSGDFRAALRALPLGPSSYVAVITRGHEHDAECLEEVLKKDTAYVGLIGSRRRTRFVLDALSGKGIPAGRRADVFTPIGVPTGGDSPEEIALAIAAEVACVRARGTRAARALRSE